MRKEIIEESENERMRQISIEGWSLGHDDGHKNNELAIAASGYCNVQIDSMDKYLVPDNWPFDEDWFKPSTPRRNLIKAAALIVAEIERIDRQEIII